MAQGLAFTLWAPLGAMGDIAVGERRGGFDRPARSAVFGLVAAALGLERSDEAGHAALEAGYRLALRVRVRGILVEDYHTVQTPAADRKAGWATRRDALRAEKLETLLSTRDYRADPVVNVVLIRLTDAGPTTEEICAALRRPFYTLYFGRKSCPLGLPLAPIGLPKIERLADAFGAVDQAEAPFAQDLFAILQGNAGVSVYVDTDLSHLLGQDYRLLRVERRRDRVASRRGWQFELRDEIVAEPVAGGAR